MGHAAYRRKALDVLLSNDIKIPGQTGDATGEPRVPSRSRSCSIFPNAPGLADQIIVASRKESLRAKAAVREEKRVRFLSAFLDLRESELGLVRYGPANRGPPGCFWLVWRAIFQIKIPARPGENLGRSESSTSCMECVLFLKVMGRESYFSESGKTLAKPCAEASLGSRDAVPRTEAFGMFLRAKGSSFDRDSGLTGGALDDPRVARCS
uniref:Uncharacterized protein n=1 Tax=Fagus sylvatica TaxID=28930 RepID=A0A2N9I9A4_FAGSY